MARLVSGPSVTRVISPGRRRASSRMRSTACRSDSGRVGGGSSAWPEALRPVRLGRRLERADERRLAPERDLDVGPAGELEDRPRVDRDLRRVDVARHAGRGDELGVGRGGRVEEREAVVDPGVDVEDEGRPLGHGPMLAERSPSPARPAGRGCGRRRRGRAHRPRTAAARAARPARRGTSPGRRRTPAGARRPSRTAGRGAAGDACSQMTATPGPAKVSAQWPRGR